MQWSNLPASFTQLKGGAWDREIRRGLGTIPRRRRLGERRLKMNFHFSSEFSQFLDVFPFHKNLSPCAYNYDSKSNSDSVVSEASFKFLVAPRSYSRRRRDPNVKWDTRHL